LYLADPVGGEPRVLVPNDRTVQGPAGGRPTEPRFCTRRAASRATIESFAVAPDGQRVLLHVTKPGARSAPDEIVVDWLRWLRK
jgi:hypothetical protein